MHEIFFQTLRSKVDFSEKDLTAIKKQLSPTKLRHEVREDWLIDRIK